MAKQFAKKFYNSKEWLRCRESYIAKVNYLCERCLVKGKIVAGNQLHHKIHLTPSNINEPDVTLNHANLEFLCDDCHIDEHNFDREKVSKVRVGLKFNELGELVEEYCEA